MNKRWMKFDLETKKNFNIKEKKNGIDNRNYQEVDKKQKTEDVNKS